MSSHEKTTNTSSIAGAQRLLARIPDVTTRSTTPAAIQPEADSLPAAAETPVEQEVERNDQKDVAPATPPPQQRVESAGGLATRLAESTKRWPVSPRLVAVIATVAAMLMIAILFRGTGELPPVHDHHDHANVAHTDHRPAPRHPPNASPETVALSGDSSWEAPPVPTVTAPRTGKVSAWPAAPKPPTVVARLSDMKSGDSPLPWRREQRPQGVAATTQPGPTIAMPNKQFQGRMPVTSSNTSRTAVIYPSTTAPSPRWSGTTPSANTRQQRSYPTAGNRTVGYPTTGYPNTSARITPHRSATYRTARGGTTLQDAASRARQPSAARFDGSIVTPKYRPEYER